MMQLWRIDESTFNFRVLNKQFVGLESQGQGTLIAVSNDPSNSGTFQIIKNDGDSNRVRIKVTDGSFIQVLLYSVQVISCGIMFVRVLTKLHV